MKIIQKFILVILAVFVIYGHGHGENLVENFSVNQDGDQIRIIVKTKSKVSYEIEPFDTRVYTLLRLYPLQFSKQTKKRFTAPLQNVSIPIKALELMDQSVMLTFKGVYSDQLKVILGDQGCKVDIIVFPRKSKTNKMQGRKKGNQAEYYFEKALDYADVNRNAEAIDAIHHVLRYQPRHAGAYFLAGKIRFVRHEWRKAEINFKKALSYDPDVGNAEPYLTKIDSIQNPHEYKTSQQSIEPEKPKESDHDTLEANTASVSSDLDGHSDSTGTETLSSTISPKSIFDFEKNNFGPTINRSGAFGDRNKGYLQLGLFLMIVFGLIVWGIILYRRRNSIKSIRKKSSPNFARLLEQLQKKPLTQKDDHQFRNEQMEQYEHSPMVEAEKDASYASNDRTAPERTDFYRNLSFGNNNRTQKVLFTPEDSIEEKVMHFAAMGYSVEEIARHLQMGKGEVELMLNYSGRQTPLSAPEVRIQME